MDNNNNVKLDCEVIDRGKKGNYQTGCTLPDKDCTHFLPVKRCEHGSSIYMNNGELQTCYRPLSDSLRECRGHGMRAKLITSNKTGSCRNKELGSLNNLETSLEEKALYGTSEVLDSGSVQINRKLVEDAVDLGMTCNHDLTKYLVQEEEKKRQKLMKKRSVIKMLDANENLKNSFEEHMVDLADQAKQDDWVKTGSAVCYKGRGPLQTEVFDAADAGTGTGRSSGPNCLDLQSEENRPTALDVILKKRKSFQEKSHSSNSLINKPGKQDVMVPKVMMENSSHIIEARPKSHHFLW